MIVIWSKEENMQKQCTNSRCRRSFSTANFTGFCPWCGKWYKRIQPPVRSRYRYLEVYGHTGVVFPVTYAVYMLGGIKLSDAKALAVSLATRSSICVRVTRPYNLANSERVLREGGVSYRFTGRGKRKH